MRISGGVPQVQTPPPQHEWGGEKKGGPERRQPQGTERKKMQGAAPEGGATSGWQDLRLSLQGSRSFLTLAVNR